MPRRGRVSRRSIAAEPIYGSDTLARFINKVMRDGEKAVAQRQVYGALELIKEKSGKEPASVFEQAIKNAMPLLEVRPRRVGGATYQVPVEVRAERRWALAMRWLIRHARARNERTMIERLAGELMDCANNTGATVKRKEEAHRMAEANKAFAHYRW
ncbi:MAG TPA: 30S ribosomal protein S7 [Clostridiales bacterium UBA8153]|nr:30S ribosomal protein S7 [Clostridiales bacterium UBA8153]